MFLGRCLDAWPRGLRVRGPEDVGDHLAEAIGSLRQTALMAVALDPVSIVRRVALRGLWHDLADADPSWTFRVATGAGASALVVAHNHPSGFTAPTKLDLAFTDRLIQMGSALEIPVLDHIIVGGDSWRSLHESTRLFDNRAASERCQPEVLGGRHGEPC